MALRFVEGFDHHVTADLVKKWTSVSGAIIQAAQGRRGTAGLRINQYAEYIALTLENQPTWIVGFALKNAALPPSANAFLVEWRDAASIQCRLELTPAGAFVFMRGGGAQVAISANGLLGVGVFHYLEVLMTFHGSAGVARMRLDGTEVVTASGLNTMNSGNPYASILRLGNQSPGAGGTIGDSIIDDVYLCDATGSVPHNTFLGDCRVDTLLPTSDGTAQQWTPSTPGTHYTLVDEAAPNTTDYVSSSTIGQRDTYGMQDLAPLTGTIYGVQLNLAALKTDAGVRSLKPLLLSGASEALGAATALSTSQTYTRHVQATDPATGVAWSEAAVNAVQCGAEVA